MGTPYGTAEGFVDYHESRGREIAATWDEDYITAALLSASEWIDNIYGPSFVGYKTGGFLQEREWPRTAAVIASSIPPYIIGTSEILSRVLYATYEAAWRQAVTPGSLIVDYTPGKYKSVNISGAVAVEYRQFDYASEIQVQIGQVDTWLWPLIDEYSAARNSSYSGGVTRA